MRLNSRVEVVNFKRWPNRDGYFKVQVAVNRGLAVFFDVHESDWGEMDDRERDAYLERCAITLLNRYGDAREVRIREDGQFVPRYGEDEASA